MEKKDFRTEYRWKAWAVMSVALLILLYRWAGDALFGQMKQPPFLFEQSETLYHWLMLSGLPQQVTSNPVSAVAIDILLFGLPLLFAFTLRRLFAILFTLLVVFYFMTFNLITGHHYHSLAGLIVMTIPFWFQKEEKFVLTWELARYYLLYVFASAAFWKITRGSAFYEPQLAEILKSQQLELFLQQPDSLHAQFIQYLISNAQVAHTLLLANVVLQGSFVIGFFTKRWDGILFALAVLFCIANYYVMSIFSFELLILNLTLLDWNRIKPFLQRKGWITSSSG